MSLPPRRDQRTVETSTPPDDVAAARRLASRIAADRLIARPDPTSPDHVILSRLRDGMTLGAGRVGRKLYEAAASLTANALADPRDELRPTPAPAEPRINERESPLAWLRRRRGADGQPLLSDRGFLAGERFRVEVTRAGMLPSVTVNWSRVESASTGGAVDPAAAADATIAARQRVRCACRELGAPMAHLLIDVCAFLVPIEQAEKRRGWPARSGKVALNLALERLADHYGIETEARGRERAAIESWMGEDARSGLDHWLAAS